MPHFAQTLNVDLVPGGRRRRLDARGAMAYRGGCNGLAAVAVALGRLKVLSSSSGL